MFDKRHRYLMRMTVVEARNRPDRDGVVIAVEFSGLRCVSRGVDCADGCGCVPMRNVGVYVEMEDVHQLAGSVKAHFHTTRGQCQA